MPSSLSRRRLLALGGALAVSAAAGCSSSARRLEPGRRERDLRAPCIAGLPPQPGRVAAGLCGQRAAEPPSASTPRSSAGSSPGRTVWSRSLPSRAGGAVDLRQLDRRRIGLRLLAPLGPRVRRGPVAAGRRVGGLLPLRPVAHPRWNPPGRRPAALLVPRRRSAPALRVRAHVPLQRRARQSHPRGQWPLGERRLHVQLAVRRSRCRRSRPSAATSGAAPVELTGSWDAATRTASGQVLDQLGLDDAMDAPGSWSGFLAASVVRGRD